MKAYSKFPCGCGGNVSVERAIREDASLALVLEDVSCEHGRQLAKGATLRIVGTRSPEVADTPEDDADRWQAEPDLQPGECLLLPAADSDTIKQLRRRVSGDLSVYALIEGQLVDHITASLVLQIHDRLNGENREKYAAMPLLKMVNVAWKLASRKPDAVQIGNPVRA